MQARPITSFVQRGEASSTPAAAAAAAAAAGTATGANVAATALAQQITPLQVCGSSNSLQSSMITPPFYRTFFYYHTPLQACISVITPPGLSYPIHGPATCMFSPGLHEIAHPPQNTTPGDNSCKLQNAITGVCYLLSYTVLVLVGTFFLPKNLVTESARA